MVSISLLPTTFSWSAHAYENGQRLKSFLDGLLVERRDRTVGLTQDRQISTNALPDKPLIVFTVLGKNAMSSSSIILSLGRSRKRFWRFRQERRPWYLAHLVNPMLRRRKVYRISASCLARTKMMTSLIPNEPVPKTISCLVLFCNR